jgi:hypothetical protein
LGTRGPGDELSRPAGRHREGVLAGRVGITLRDELPRAAAGLEDLDVRGTGRDERAGQADRRPVGGDRRRDLERDLRCSGCRRRLEREHREQYADEERSPKS